MPETSSQEGAIEGSMVDAVIYGLLLCRRFGRSHRPRRSALLVPQHRIERFSAVAEAGGADAVATSAGPGLYATTLHDNL
jgi:hypothetical protein